MLELNGGKEVKCHQIVFGSHPSVHTFPTPSCEQSLVYQVYWQQSCASNQLSPIMEITMLSSFFCCLFTLVLNCLLANVALNVSISIDFSHGLAYSLHNNSAMSPENFKCLNSLVICKIFNDSSHWHNNSAMSPKNFKLFKFSGNQ